MPTTRVFRGRTSGGGRHHHFGGTPNYTCGIYIKINRMVIVYTDNFDRASAERRTTRPSFRFPGWRTDMRNSRRSRHCSATSSVRRTVRLVVLSISGPPKTPTGVGPVARAQASEARKFRGLRDGTKFKCQFI